MNNIVGLTDPCRLCGRSPSEFTDTENPVDPCLGILPGVAHACCGHGITRAHDGTPVAYVVIGGEPGESCTEIDDYRVLNGVKALEYFASLGVGPKVAV